MNRAILLMVGLAMTLTGGGRAAAESAAKPLPEGVSMLPADSLAALALTGATAGSASVETVPVEGQAFAKALRVRVVRQPASPWLLQLYAVTVAPVEKGDVLLATFWLRCVESSTGEGTAALVFEIARDPWTKSIEFPVSVGREWKKFQIPFASAGSYAAGRRPSTCRWASGRRRSRSAVSRS